MTLILEETAVVIEESDDEPIILHKCKVISATDKIVVERSLCGLITLIPIDQLIKKADINWLKTPNTKLCEECIEMSV